MAFQIFVYFLLFITKRNDVSRKVILSMMKVIVLVVSQHCIITSRDHPEADTTTVPVPMTV